VQVLGLVQGSSARAHNLLHHIQAAWRTLIGGRAGVYAELQAHCREEAIATMVAEAMSLGANAVVAVRISASNRVGVAEVVAYGTAVVIE
jgi:uncharacterized protein YbjQ (UPF0145 family)